MKIESRYWSDKDGRVYDRKEELDRKAQANFVMVLVKLDFYDIINPLEGVVTKGFVYRKIPKVAR